MTSGDVRLLRAPRTMPETRFATVTWLTELTPMHLLGAPLSIRSMNSDLAETISDLLGQPPPHPGGPLTEDDPGLVSIVDRGEGSKRRFALYSGRSRLAIAKEDGPILAVLWNSLPLIVSAGSDRLVMVASVANRTGGAVLVSGRGGPTGPLIDRLVESGYRCASGVVGVGLDDALVTPVSLPRLIDGAWTAPDLTATDAPGPARVVVCPSAADGSDVEVTQLRPAEAVIALCEHSLNLHRHGQVGLDALARVVQGADRGCWRVRYDIADPSAAVATITELLSPA